MRRHTLAVDVPMYTVKAQEIDNVMNGLAIHLGFYRQKLGQYLAANKSPIFWRAILDDEHAKLLVAQADILCRLFPEAAYSDSLLQARAGYEAMADAYFGRVEDENA